MLGFVHCGHSLLWAGTRIEACSCEQEFHHGGIEKMWGMNNSWKGMFMQTQVSQPEKIEQLIRGDQEAVEASIWSLLHQAAMSRMVDLIKAINEIAPEPGTLVYVEAKRLSYNWDGWRPILFSAVDVCTHLQIARMYLTPTHASAIDFLQFLVHHYPFQLKEIRTNGDPVFINPFSTQSEHQFTAEAKKIGIFHTIALDPMNHPIMRVITKYVFGGAFEGSVEETSEEKVITGFVNFLFFHNNYRSLASLGGLTPLQKLNSFQGFENIIWFDPYRPLELRKKGNGLY